MALNANAGMPLCFCRVGWCQPGAMKLLDSVVDVLSGQDVTGWLPWCSPAPHASPAPATRLLFFLHASLSAYATLPASPCLCLPACLCARLLRAASCLVPLLRAHNRCAARNSVAFLLFTTAPSCPPALLLLYPLPLPCLPLFFSHALFFTASFISYVWPPLIYTYSAALLCSCYHI